jgi:hypothetical protein
VRHKITNTLYTLGPCCITYLGVSVCHVKKSFSNFNYAKIRDIMLNHVKEFDLSVGGYRLHAFIFKNCLFYVVGVFRKSNSNFVVV